MTLPRPAGEPPAPSVRPQEGLPVPQRYIAIAVLLASILMLVLDGSIVNIALPTIAKQMDVGAADVVWVLGAYQLALVVSLLPFAVLGESRGYRRVFFWGMVVFMAGSLLCAVSSTLPALVASRLLQGFGASAGMSVFAALLRHTYPPRLIGRAIGLNALCVSLSSAIGPTLGASVLAVANWPWLFLINLPICVLILIGVRTLPVVAPMKRHIDTISALLNALFFGLLIFGFEEITRTPLISIAMILASLVSLHFLVRREAGRAAPLVPLDLLRMPTIRLAGMASSCAFASQMLVFIALPFYLQRDLGHSEVATGLLMTPWPLAAAVTSAIVGRLSDKMPTSILCASGGALVAAAAALDALWPLQHGIGPLIAFNVIGGIGFGCFQSPNNRTMLTGAPIQRSGAVGGLQATARQFGLSSGAALAALMFSFTPAHATGASLALGALLAGLSALASVIRSRGEPDRR